MAIWVGHDGTLNDDEGDGPAVAGDPIEILALQTGYGPQVGCCGDFDVYGEQAEALAGGYGSYPGHFRGFAGHYVGDDFGSALGSIGSALGSAFGGSGGGGGGGGGDLGSSIGSAFGNLFGGDSGGSTGAAIGDVIGKVAKVAVPLTAQAISKASSSHAQAAQAHGAVAQAHAQLAQAHAQAAQTSAPTQTHARQAHADPKTRLNLQLSHLAKQYNMPPPSGSSGAVQATSDGDGTTTAKDVGAFVQNLMKSTAQTSGHFVGDLASLFGGGSSSGDGSGDGSIVDDLTASLRRGFSSHAARPQPHAQQQQQQRSTYAPPHVTHTPAPYAPPPVHHTYTVPTPQARRSPPSYLPPPTYGQQGYGYGADQGIYSDYGQQGYGPDYMGPGTYPPVTPTVTYQPAAMPPLTRATTTPRTTHVDQTAARNAQQRQQADQAPPTAKLGTFVKKMMGGPAYGGTGRGTGVADEDLRNYQKGINTLYGFEYPRSGLNPDGLMGPETKKYTKAFQDESGLPVTGNPDAATKAMLVRKLEEQRISRETPSTDWRTRTAPTSESAIDWGTVGTYAKKIAEMGVIPAPMRAAMAAKEELERRKAEERVRQLEGTPEPEKSWWSL